MKNLDNEKKRMEFFEALKGPSLEDTIAAYKRYCHPSIVWKNSGFPDIVGFDAVEHLLREQKKLFDFERVKVLQHRLLASDGDHVFFEREDTIVNSKDEVVFAFDILGVFEFEDGLIVRWADYMDTTAVRENWDKSSFDSL
ncbi:MAG: limonene-1,2-epoxide hydrolase family protein [Lacipirellulaceae bacterium]